MEPDRPTFFFMHIMKTAGTSFVRHVNVNFGADEIWPAPTPDRRMEEYWELSEVAALGPERRARIRMFYGHFPLMVADVVGADTILTLLRDPVERVVSHIRHHQRHHLIHHGRPLEAVYEDGWLHPHYFCNYQVRQFALTPEDRPKASNEIIEMDEDRLARARANLDRVSVLGLTDHFPAFLDEVTERFDWTRLPGLRLQASPGSVDIPHSLRARIEADNEAELVFYEDARERHRSRAKDRQAGRHR